MADNIFPREILGELKPLVAITCLAEAEGDKIKEADLLRQLRPKAFHVASLKSTPFGSLSAYLQHKHCAPGSSFARKQSYDGTPQTGSTGSGGGSGSSSSSNTAGSSAGAGLGDSTGIIKCNWFQKRVNLMPAAVLAFFVSSGSDQDWKTKENELAALMETERKFFKARGIRLLLVLVLANGENILAVEEKLSSLKKRVDLDTKQVIIATPNIDSITSTIETPVSETVHQHFKEETRRNKSLLRGLQKLTHPNTQIRLSIKVAYLSELRKDFHNAIKYYKNSSALLNDLKFAYDRDWPRVYEIKEVLSMVNFRICYIMFVENKTTREAVQQFQNHIRAYKSSVAIPYMETLHWTSIEAQLLAFGKLLASQKSIIHRERGSYHPAHYFHEAAHALILRKKAAAHQYDTYRSKPSVAIARQALEDTPADKRAEFLTRSPSSKYFFHFEKIRPQKTSELCDDDSRIIAYELFFYNHNEDILKKFSLAYDMCKASSNSARSLLSLSMEIAFQYAEQGRWLDAKKILDGLTTKYAEEMWNDILTEIYLLLRDCSMHLFLPSEFVINSLQLIQHSSTLSLPAKCEIQKDIHDIVFQEKDDRVVDPSLLNPLSANSASMDNTSGAEPLLFLKAPLSITDIEQFFRVKFNFTKKLIYVQETTEFELEVTSFFPAEFALTELSTEFSNSFVVSKHCDGDDDTLKFLPNVPKEFTFQITPSASGPLKVSSISMTIGQGRSKVSFVYTPDYKSPTMAGSSCSSENKDILIVNERPSKVKISSKHEPPSNQGEMYSYTVVVTNNHDKAITNGVISVATQFQNSIFLTKDANTVFSPQSIKAPIQPGASEELEVFIKMFSLEERIINVSFQYSVQEAQDLDMAASFRENLLVLSPFFTSFTFFDENLLQLPNGASLQSCRPFFMCASLQPSTPYPLEIVRSEVEFTEGERCFKALNTSAEFTLPEAVDKPVDVSINSRYQLWFKLQPTEECPLNMNVFVGTLHVTYTRCPKNDTDEPSLLNFEANIQPVKLETPAFIVERYFTPSCVLGKAIYDKVVVKSNSTVTEDLNISLEESPHFFASGPNSSEFSIIPGGSVTINLAFVPLATGQLTLPNIQITQQAKKKIPCPKKVVYVYPF